MSVENQPASTSQQQHSQPPKSSSNDLHLTLYWAAIQQLPPEHLQQQSTAQNPVDSQTEVNSATKCFDFRGNSLNDQGIYD
ncbi:zinc finger domain-containing protein [Euroglyphus maynei]|uniref:Zinc finger domain-containing protein n=1 Tax=Euroglyphus maynei TaxID=6958 RepID=A0A1Y3BBI0_EURMA|nr:zinc finger domain-containing protein [Euroglyphus maynei]